MKKLFSTLLFLLLMSSICLGQTSFFGGLNAAESTNKGFWGINPTVGIQHPVSTNFNINLRLNGFLDLKPKSDIPQFQGKNYHRSFYSDLGIDFRIIDRAVDWSIGAGGSYQVGVEKYVSGAGWYGDKLTSYKTEKNSFSRFGVFIKNSIKFGETVSLNMTIYRFTFWGDYLSFGPSFKIK